MATSAAHIDYDEGAAPATPVANRVRLYAKTDGLLYSKDDAGAETLVSGGAGGSGGGLASGTSFPGAPSTNDRFFRTDRGLVYFYDGIRWLTETLYAQTLAGQDSLTPTTTSPVALGRLAVWTDDYDMWVVDFRWSSYVTTTNNGSAYWTVAFRKNDGTVSSLIVSGNTSADSPNAYTRHKSAVGALLGTTQQVIMVDVTKTGSPGALYLTTMMTYRLVG